MSPQPLIHLNWLAIVAAVAAAHVIGFLWYGPLFGKAWQKEMGLPMDFKPTGAQIGKAIVLQLIGAFLTACVLSYTVDLWRPSVWMAGADKANYVYGLCGGVLTWIGFYVPQVLSMVAWENRSWKLFWINAANHFVTLLAMGQILANWH